MFSDEKKQRMKRAGGEEATRRGRGRNRLALPTYCFFAYLYSIQAVDTNKVL